MLVTRIVFRLYYRCITDGPHLNLLQLGFWSSLLPFGYHPSMHARMYARMFVYLFVCLVVSLFDSLRQMVRSVCSRGSFRGRRLGRRQVGRLSFNRTEVRASLCLLSLFDFYVCLFATRKV